MRVVTTTTNVYEFDELSEEAQRIAISGFRDINVSHDWWDNTYEDVANIGLKLEGFDLDRGNYCKGKIIGTHEETARLIIENHGEQCETYKTAKKFIEEFNRLCDENTDGQNDSDIDDLQDDFLNEILEDYKKILRDEYDYLTSGEAIMESIEANDYEFTEDGEQF